MLEEGLNLGRAVQVDMRHQPQRRFPFGAGRHHLDQVGVLARSEAHSRLEGRNAHHVLPVAAEHCETGEVREVMVTPEILARYKEVFDAFCQDVEGYCTKRQILYFRAPIQTAFDELVLRIFRAGGFLK